MEDLLFAPGSLCQAAPSYALQVSVIVPAKDEEENLWQTLESLYRQTDAEGNSLDKNRYEVIVLANNCTDHTAALAQQFAALHPDLTLHVADIDLPPRHAHIGYVRRMLMDEAYRRLTSLGHSRGVIASTDGDTIADPAWLWHILQAIAEGADAVGGRILTQPFSNNTNRLYHLQDVTYRYLVAQLEARLDPDPADPWPRHFQHFGPSLAVTCEMYHKVGRLPVRSSLEDVAFFEALQRYDGKIRHSPAVKVTTSSRRTGRVDFGFSVQLNLWETMQEQRLPMLVPGLAACSYTATVRKQLRSYWQHPSLHQKEIALLAGQLGLDACFLYALMVEAPYFGMFYQQLMHDARVVQNLAARFPPEPVASAVAALRAYVADRSNRSRR